MGTAGRLVDETGMSGGGQDSVLRPTIAGAS